jgi:protein O-mannosyl-transferase
VEGNCVSVEVERATGGSRPDRPPACTSSLPWARADTLFAGAQVLLIAIVYARTLRFDFVLDDFPLILHNPLVLAPWRSIPRFFTEGYFDRIFPNAPPNDYRPMLSVWLLVNQKLWNFNPAGWHLAPIFLLFIVTLGVYALARRIFADRALACLTALIFALHPIHVETTAWIIGMNESLMAAPFMASFLCFLKARSGGSRRMVWHAASLSGYALAICAKEDAIALPVLVGAFTWVYGHEVESSGGGMKLTRLRTAFAVSLPYFALTGIYLAVRLVVLHGLSHPQASISRGTLFWTAPLALWTDVRLLLWPSGLSIFYESPYVSGPLATNFLLPVGALAACLAALWVWSEKSREVQFGVIWLIVPVLPFLDLKILPEGEFVHDRYLYLSSIGFALLVASAVRGLGRSRSAHLKATISAVLLVGAYAGLSYYYSRFWANNMTLFVRGATLAPGNNAAISSLANEFAVRGDYPVASRFYQTVLARAPNFWMANYNLGVCDYKMGRYEDALTPLSRAAELDPSEPDIFVYAGLSLYRLGRLPEAESALQRAIAFEPSGAGYHLALGMVLKARGERERALAEFRQELAYHPEESPARQAIADLQSPSSQRPDSPGRP